jgi:hypothetical protein
VPFGFTRQPELDAIAPLHLPKSMVLEVRAGRGFTVFPPSAIDGDLLVFNRAATNDIPEMQWEDVRSLAGLLAFVSFVAACYPPEGGRDWFCFHLAGALVHLGVEPDTADEIVVAVARLNGDHSDERRGKARAAAAKRDAGGAVTRLPALLAHLGMGACEKRVREWLQLDEPGEEAPADAVVLGRPDLHAVLADVEGLLIERSGRVFRRHAELVRVSQLDEAGQENGVYRHAGLVELRTAAPAGSPSRPAASAPSSSCAARSWCASRRRRT